MQTWERSCPPGPTGPINPFFLAFSSPAATPEPGSLALAAGALVQGAALLYRRRRKPAGEVQPGVNQLSARAPIMTIFRARVVPLSDDAS